MTSLLRLLQRLLTRPSASSSEVPQPPPPATPRGDVAGPLTDDCRYAGPGVYYLYLTGESAPVYVGKSKNVRHRLRWHRYHLQQGNYPENPPIELMRWEALRFPTEPEAWQFEQQEIRRLKPRWNGTGMSRRAIKARRAA
jgi:predicted GIY-YIG superfamily endonuclease